VTVPGLRLAFAGTPEFAAVILRSLLSCGRHLVHQVYTLPDRPAGRGRKPAASPVARVATNHGLRLLRPATPRDIDPSGLSKFDACIVAAFGLILPAPVLAAPRFGCINVHASLLPRWRGAAPIQRAILAGDSETGISIMQMDAGLDTGDVLLQESCAIGADETAGALHDRLAVLGAGCLLRVLDALADGRAERRPQDHSLATYAAKIGKDEAAIDWSREASEIVRKVRAFNPAPVAEASLRGLHLRIWEAREIAASAAALPGAVVACTPNGIDVAAGRGAVRILRLQLPGRKPIAARDFLNANPAWRRGAEG
jgi:methionyl-tRNA formyltransferase